MKCSFLPGILLSIFFVSCESGGTKELAKSAIPDLTGTRWEYHYPDTEEGNILLFYKEPVYSKKTEPNSIREKKGWFTEYEYELGFQFSGTYEVRGDTLYMTHINYISDVSVSEKEVKEYSKWVLSDKGLLYPVYRHRKTGASWVESSPPEYLMEYMQVSKKPE